VLILDRDEPKLNLLHNVYCGLLVQVFLNRDPFSSFGDVEGQVEKTVRSLLVLCALNAR
jgi:hypothetical protein